MKVRDQRQEQLRDFGELFRSFDPKVLARNTDPDTSHKSAKTVSEFMGDHHRKIYEALKTMKDGTFYEISTIAEMEPASVWRRLNELEKLNRIHRTGEERRGPTNRLCAVWRVSA